MSEENARLCAEVRKARQLLKKTNCFRPEEIKAFKLIADFESRG